MKRLVYIFLAAGFIAFTGGSALAQSVATYEIVEKAGVDDIGHYQKVLQSASIDKYRLPYARAIMNFESGVKVELLSGEELLEKGVPVDLGNYLGRQEGHIKNSVFTAHESGRLLEMRMAPQSVPVKKTK